MQQIGSSAAQDSVALENPESAFKWCLLRESGLTERAIAAEMGVSLSTVNRAVTSLSAIFAAA